MSENNTTAVSSKSDWKIPIWLLVLTFIPMAAGISRLIGLSGGVTVSPENSRFFEAPVPIVIHIISVCFNCVFGAFQFSAGLRKRNLTWHRITGRLLIPAGILSALSGLWMTVLYPIPFQQQGPPLMYFRIFVAVAMVTSLVLGFTTILKRKISEHSAWMIRAYALGQGAGTQVITLLPFMLLIGEPSQFTRDMLMILAWVINMGIGEWIIRRKTKPKLRLNPVVA
ncbi:MAG: DUF2306 domain-containing protein [Bacteroidetes bacterium]|nr:DUF2306 domain-containing protein [Bacteroidota bacterium]